MGCERIQRETHGSHNCIEGITCYTDYGRAMQAGIRSNKPILINFTGQIACDICRRLGPTFKKDLALWDMLQNDMLVLCLYVDDTTALDFPYHSEVLGDVNTLGERWLDLQVQRFEDTTQPYLILVDGYEGHLTEGIRFSETYDLNEFRKTLAQGLETFNSR